MKVAIIGGGVSGLFCALNLRNCQVFVFEKNDSVGLKLNITGKGRCNFTNNCDQEEFLSNVVTNPRFLFSALSAFSPQDTIEFFNNLGIQSVTERGKRVFPKNIKASDVSKTLFDECKKRNVKFIFEKVESVGKKSQEFLIKTSQSKYEFDFVIVCTGGKSYPVTGSTGDGYEIAKSFAHTIVSLKPALIPIQTKENVLSICGLNLKNVQVQAISKKKKFSYFGEVEFWSKGLCGPTILTLSSYLNKYDLADFVIHLDLKPALTEDKLDARILRELSNQANKNLKDVLVTLVPSKLVGYLGKIAGVDLEKSTRIVTRHDRENIVKALKNLKFTPTALDNIDRAIITSGGVSVKEVNPSTMESKIVSGLYFAGEILDVDALTGGFNMQIAFSTAFCVAKNLNIKIEENNYGYSN